MIKGKYIITTTDWFTTPNGREYRAVWGDVEVLNDSILGIKTNRNSTNWYLKVGTDDNHVIIAGCQVNYAVKSESSPITDEKVMHEIWGDGNHLEFKRNNPIYFAI